LGRALLAKGDATRAAGLLTGALKTADGAAVPPLEQARARFTLAQALCAERRECPQALASAVEAEAVFRRLGVPEAGLALAWIDRRQGTAPSRAASITPP
jgi:hypothetical protein